MNAAVEILAQALTVKDLQATEFLVKGVGVGAEAESAARRAREMEKQIGEIQDAIEMLKTGGANVG